MRPEKADIVSDLSEKLNGSSFMLVTDYQKMKVPQFGELRNRLSPLGGEIHVVKNSFLKRAMATSGLPMSAIIDWANGSRDRSGRRGADREDPQDVRGRI
jgi:ribosomal protein L10